MLIFTYFDDETKSNRPAPRCPEKILNPVQDPAFFLPGQDLSCIFTGFIMSCPVLYYFESGILS